MEKLLKYASNTNKPFFLLLPNYVYTKPYYISALYNINKKTNIIPFYITPKKRYLYTTPKGRRQIKSSKFTSPFPTFWYCSLPDM
jgi:hypothetical protein